MQKLSELINSDTGSLFGATARTMRRITLPAGLLGLWLLALLHNPGQVCGATVATYGTVLTWDRSTSPGVSGYRIFYGTASGKYTNSFTVGNVTATTILGLSAGVPYFFAVRAFTVTGVESG